MDAIGVWLRPVERTVRVREVGGSNPLTPTGMFAPPYPKAVIFLKQRTPWLRESFALKPYLNLADSWQHLARKHIYNAGAAKFCL